MKQATTLFIFFFALKTLNAQPPKGIDVTTGRDILNLLPATMQGQNRNAANDIVVEARGFIGVVVHRNYGAGQKKIALEVINNSPSVDNVNAILAQTSASGTNQYTITKVNGHDAVLQPFTGEAGSAGYELLIPVKTTLITLKTLDYTKDQFLQMANTIPVALIAQKVQ